MAQRDALEFVTSGLILDEGVDAMSAEAPAFNGNQPSGGGAISEPRANGEHVPAAGPPAVGYAPGFFFRCGTVICLHAEMPVRLVEGKTRAG